MLPGFSRYFTVLFLVLGLSLGAMTSNSIAAKQVFAPPCAMGDMQKQDGSCCKGNCAGAKLNCIAKCATPVDHATVADTHSMTAIAGMPRLIPAATPGQQLTLGPAPPVPIL